MRRYGSILSNYQRTFQSNFIIENVTLKVIHFLLRETIRRKDGTLPSEWFHLPDGAETPSVDRLIKEDSPDPELEALSTTDSLSVAQSEENILEDTTGKRTPGRKTPSGRSRTPIFGKHRNRHKSTGSSPAPSLKSHGTAAAKSPKLCHQRTLSQPEVTSPTSSHAANGGYEPVGKDRIQNSQSVGKLPQSRPPDSQLPTLPNDGDDSDTAESCFPLRKSRSRSRSRERKKKKVSARSQSRESRWSDPDHPYETPKLLPKHQRRDEDRRSKSHQDMSLIEYGYEPIGRPASIKKLEEEEAALNLDEKLTETDTVLHLSRHNDGKLKTTSSIKKTKQSKSLLNNIIDKVKKLSKEESHTIIERKDSKEEETVAGDKDHPVINKEEELHSKDIKAQDTKPTELTLLRVKEEEQEEEMRRQQEIQQETRKREKKESERQIQEEERKQKREQERELKQAQEIEKKRRKEEAKVLKREQEAEQLRMRKLKEEQEKNVKREREAELKRHKIREEEEKQEAKRLKKAEELELKNLKKLKEEQEKKMKKEKEDILRQQKRKEDEERRILKINKDEEQKKIKETKEKEEKIANKEVKETYKKLAKAEKKEEELRLKQVREQTEKRENEIRVSKDSEEKGEPIYADEVPLK